MEDFKPWQGGKGIVRKVNTERDCSYFVEVREVPPTNNAVRVGHTTWFDEEWLRVVEAAKPAGEDVVNHPSHYGGGDNPYEVIKVAEAWGFDRDSYLFNVLKYIARAGKKGSKVEDLEKGVFYLQRKIKRVKEEEAK